VKLIVRRCTEMESGGRLSAIELTAGDGDLACAFGQAKSAFGPG